jgi:hypothetical protein
MASKRTDTNARGTVQEFKDASMEVLATSKCGGP